MPNTAGFPYRNDISDAVPALPLFGIQDRAGAPYSIVEAEAVAPVPVVGRSVLQLVYVPDAGEDFIATLGGVPQVRVAWGTVPSAGEFAVDFDGSRVEFPAAQQGETYLLTFTGTAVAISSDLLNRWILATDAKLDSADIGVTVQAYDATLDTLSTTTPGALGLSLLADATAADARTTLGLGSLATLSSVNNANWSGTALAIANGGTGSTTAANARTALGLAIGTNVQAWSPALDTLGAGDPSPFAVQELLEVVDAPDARSAIGAAPRRAEITTVSANYTLLSSDEGKVVVVADDAGITVPPGLPTGWQTTVVVRDSVTAEIVEGSGVDIEGEGVVLDEPGRAIHLLHIGGDVFLAIGAGVPV